MAVLSRSCFRALAAALVLTFGAVPIFAGTLLEVKETPAGFNVVTGEDLALLFDAIPSDPVLDLIGVENGEEFSNLFDLLNAPCCDGSLPETTSTEIVLTGGVLPTGYSALYYTVKSNSFIALYRWMDTGGNTIDTATWTFDGAPLLEDGSNSVWGSKAPKAISNVRVWGTIPEPSSMLLAGLSLLCISAAIRRAR